MRSLIIVGCGGHARSVIDLVEAEKKWNIYGLIGLENELNKCVLGHKVIGSDENLADISVHCSNAVVGIGQISTNSARLAIINRLKQLDYSFPTIISPKSYVSPHSRVGYGVTIGHGVVVNANAVIGNHCIINSQALIEHDVLISDFCHISTGSLVNGCVNIGKSSFIGSGAVIRNNLSLPSGTVVGAGKTIMGWPLKN